VSHAIIAAGLGAALLLPHAVHAAPPPITDSTDMSDQECFCLLVENLGNDSMNGAIVAEINRLYDGWEMPIRGGKRKTLTTGTANRVTFKGCKMRLDLNAEMDRKVRRDAKGVLIINAVVTNMRLDRRAGTGRGCLRNVKIDRVIMSNTTRVAESIYEKVANKMVENNVCFDFAVPG
jgi:hypothetical protein